MRYSVGLLVCLPLLIVNDLASAEQVAYYQQAPFLDGVANLAPIDQRLPENPMLVEPEVVIGHYGPNRTTTTWHMAMRDSFDHASLIRTIGYENLMRWTPDWSAAIPNVAQTVESLDNAREFKFTLRRGMRWSDGEPFTADDIQFWYEDILLDPALTPTIPFWLVADGKPVMVKKLDEVTVVFRFASPNSLFLHMLAAPEGAEPTSYPKHSLARLLPKYNPALMGTDWVAGFHAAFGTPGTIDDSTRWQHPDVPTLNPWQLTAAYGAANPLIAERNPYYWKVDPAGRQLPYIDRVSFAIVKDRRAAAALAMQGIIDMQARHVRCCAKEILAARSEYEALRIVQTEANEVVLSLNLGSDKPALREIFNRRDFRIALSLGMNRSRFIEDDPSVIPWQVAPVPESRHYHERLATQYLNYDPAEANRLLDALGYRRNADGLRLGPDQAAIEFTINCASEEREAWLKQAAEDWRALGLSVHVRLLEREDYTRRLEVNNFDAAAYTGEGGVDIAVNPSDFIPAGIQSAWGIKWWRWHQNPHDPQAEVPPASVQRQFELFEGIKATTEPAAQQALMRQILDIAAEEFFVIGLLRVNFQTAIVRRGFRNVPDFLISSWVYPDPAPTNPAQYFFAEGSQ